MPVAREPSFDLLLDYLRRSRGCDLEGYKRPGLKRRVTRRLRRVGVGDYAGYVEYLAAHPEEFPLLFESLLINVTSFFRDPPVWDALREEVVPRLARSRGRRGLLRVWSAGCATGQEAWSLAIVLAEAAGMDRYPQGVRIYATDVDEPALRIALSGRYAAKDLEGVPAAWRRRYFARDGETRVIREDLRGPVLFGRHDLMRDAPMSRLDLICCRNTLMYFDPAAQRAILSRFHEALEPDGCLVLGEAEMLFALGDLFRPANPRHRIFSKAGMAARGRAEAGR